MRILACFQPSRKCAKGPELGSRQSRGFDATLERTYFHFLLALACAVEDVGHRDKAEQSNLMLHPGEHRDCHYQGGHSLKVPGEDVFHAAGDLAAGEANPAVSTLPTTKR